jgi:hypothetical protein
VLPIPLATSSTNPIAVQPNSNAGPEHREAAPPRLLAMSDFGAP